MSKGSIRSGFEGAATCRWSRTTVTAEKIAAPHRLSVQAEADLIDVDLWLHAPHLAQIPDGETLSEVHARVARALATITRQHPGELVVLVAHESVNRVILLHALDLPLSHYWRLDQAPCCINEIEAKNDGFFVIRVNDSAHVEQPS